MKRFVTVLLSEFARAALRGEEGQPRERLAARLVGAIRLYLGDRDASRPGWAYPDFLPTDRERDSVEIEISVDEELWRAFGQEADAQGVSTSQLAEHAALLYAADVDAGRITERILEDLGEGEVQEGGLDLAP
jgi:hypothetical protein